MGQRSSSDSRSNTDETARQSPPWRARELNHGRQRLTPDKCKQEQP